VSPPRGERGRNPRSYRRRLLLSSPFLAAAWGARPGKARSAPVAAGLSRPLARIGGRGEARLSQGAAFPSDAMACRHSGWSCSGGATGDVVVVSCLVQSAASAGAGGEGFGRRGQWSFVSALVGGGGTVVVVAGPSLCGGRGEVLAAGWAAWRPAASSLIGLAVGWI
jgi:hypothetical protein